MAGCVVNPPEQFRALSGAPHSARFSRPGRLSKIGGRVDRGATGKGSGHMMDRSYRRPRPPKGGLNATFEHPRFAEGLRGVDAGVLNERHDASLALVQPFVSCTRTGLPGGSPPRAAGPAAPRPRTSPAPATVASRGAHPQHSRRGPPEAREQDLGPLATAPHPRRVRLLEHDPRDRTPDPDRHQVRQVGVLRRPAA